MAAKGEEIGVNKWIVTLTTMLGSLMALLDSTIVNIALPRIMTSFGVSVGEIEWVVTAYLMALSVAMPAVGWLSGVLGRGRLYCASLTLFTLGSALCGLAWSRDTLILFRIIQGIGAGAIMPTAMATIYEAFPPHQRGFAMGIYGLGVTFGPAAGPVVGGYITEYFSWRWIFYVNLPIGALGLAAAFYSLRGLSRPARGEGKGFDAVGFLTMAASLTVLLIALSKGQEEGWRSGYIVWLLAASAMAFAVFLLAEKRSISPLIDLRLYSAAPYALATVVGASLGAGLFGSTFLAPMLLENLLGYSAFKTGMLMLPGALAVSATLPISGVLSDRIDSRVPIVAGLLTFALSLFFFSRIDLGASSANVAAAFVLRGLGLGMIFPALANASLGAVPFDSVSMASGLMNVTRQLGGSFGIALLSTYLGAREAFHKALGAGLLAGGSHPVGNAAAGAGTSWTTGAQLSKEASVAAFQDSFFLIALMFLAAIIPALLISSRVGERDQKISPDAGGFIRQP